MWKVCYRMEDCIVSEVMDGLHIDRSPLRNSVLTATQRRQVQEQRRLSRQAPSDSMFLHHDELTKTRLLESEHNDSSDSEAED